MNFDIKFQLDGEVEEHPQIHMPLGENHSTKTEVVFCGHDEMPCLLLRQLLSLEECEMVQRNLEDVEWTGNKTDHRFRRHGRTTFEAKEFVADLWKRIKFPAELRVTKDSFVDSACTSLGDWTATGLRPELRALRYGPDNFFAAHRDGFTRVSDDCRSFFTLLLYIDHQGEGGRTLFLDDNHPLERDDNGDYRIIEDYISHAVDPRPGDAVIFYHKELHAGERLREGSKTALLSTILFERDPKSAPDLTENEKLGLRLFEEACLAEDSGDFNTAMQKYSRAYRLNRQLADDHGM